MKKENKKTKILIVQLLSLLVAFLLCIVATVGITIAFFGNTARGDSTISLKGGVFVDGSFSASTSAQLVVPGQTVNVESVASVSSRAGDGISTTDSPTNAFLRAQMVESTSDASGSAINVTVITELTVQETTCHWEKFGDWYYLCEGETGTKLFEIDTTNHNSQATALEIEFNASFQVDKRYENDKSGAQYMVSVSFTAIQSKIGEIAEDELVCTNENIIEAFNSIQ